MRENTDQKKLRIWTLSTQWESTHTQWQYIYNSICDACDALHDLMLFVQIKKGENSEVFIFSKVAGWYLQLY